MPARRRQLAGPLVALLWAQALGAGCTPAPGSGARAAEDEAKPAREPAPPKATGAHSDPLAAPADLTAPPADAQKTASGLVTKLLEAGTGDRTPTMHDSVRVHYTGWKASGALIDSSRKHDGPATFALTGVIPGWAEGLQLMRVGERRRLWIPDHLSYVRPGPPRGTIVFDIELLEIIEGAAPAAPHDVAAPPPSATKTKSGLAYEVLAAAERKDRPKLWDRVTLSYAGWTTDGELFDVSTKATFDVGDVMPGWTELLLRMSKGERARAWIPEALAYHGRSGPPKGMVVFDIEILSIERRPEPPRAPRDVAGPPTSARKTASGLAYRVLVKGKGKTRPTASSHVQLHYSGWTTDGKLFDSSVVRGKPRTVPLRSVIAGWQEALQLMVEGDKTLFWIPEKLAYAGAKGAPAGTLVYELELLKIVE